MLMHCLSPRFKPFLLLVICYLLLVKPASLVITGFPEFVLHSFIVLSTNLYNTLQTLPSHINIGLLDNGNSPRHNLNIGP